MTDILIDLNYSGLHREALCAKRRPALPELPPLDPQLHPEALALARLNWEARTASEYVGVMVSRKLHGLLVDLSAPIDLQTLALQFMLEEQQHAELCFAVALHLGSTGEILCDLEALQQPRSTAPLGHQLIEMLVGTYAVGEVCALALITHTLKALPASPYRDVLRRIAADEVLHARFGPLVLQQIRQGHTAQWLPHPGDATLWQIAEQTRQLMRTRDVIEDEELQGAQDPQIAAQIAQLGLPAPQAFKEAYFSALDREVAQVLHDLGLRGD